MVNVRMRIVSMERLLGYLSWGHLYLAEEGTFLLGADTRNGPALPE